VRLEEKQRAVRKMREQEAEIALQVSTSICLPSGEEEEYDDVDDGGDG